MKKQFVLVLGFSLQISLFWAQIPQWEAISSPDGGGIRNFDLDSALLYALTGAGIYRSADEGYHWQVLSNSLLTTRDKRQLRVESGILYALTAEGSLVRSDDQGKSWKSLLQKPFPFNYKTEELQQLFVKGDTVLVGSLFTIYRSTNRGESWTSTLDLVPASFVSIFEFKNEIFAAQDRYIYRTSNGGMTWDSVFANAVGYAAVVPTDSFLLAFYAHKNRLVRSADGLRTWDAIDTDTLAEQFKDNPYGVDPVKWVGGSGPHLYYFQRGDDYSACPFKYCFSIDGGKTWHLGNKGEQMPIGGTLSDGINFGHHIVFGNKQIHHSIDSAHSFFVQQEGLKSASIRQVIYQKGTIFSSMDVGRSFRTTDKGETWEPDLFPADWGAVCIPSVGFLHTKERIFRFQRDEYNVDIAFSGDQGQSWNGLSTEYQYGITTTNHTFWHYERIWTQSGKKHQIWRLADTDSTFTVKEPFGPEFGDFFNVGLINLGDQLGIKIGKEFYIYDENFNLIAQLPTAPCVSSAFEAPGRLYFDGTTYYNYCDDRAYILPAGAAEWQVIYPQDWTTGAPFYHHNMMFFAAYNGLLWVGLEGKGLFYAPDNTGRFYPVQPQMPYPYPTAITFDEKSVWVGTDGGGIWTYPLPKTPEEPHGKALFQVFPNPSNGEFNLQSNLFFKDEIKLRAFDAAGRKVAEKRLSPGQYWRLEFPDLPAGMYFLQLRSATEVFGMKWVLAN